MRQKFECQACGYEGEPIEGVEEDEQERQFVGCESCGIRHLVKQRDARGPFSTLGIHPDDAGALLRKPPR